MPDLDLPELSYRRAMPEDIDLLVRLRIRFLIAFSGEQPEEKKDTLTQQLYHYFAKAIPAENYIGWMAWDGEVAAGTGGMVIREQPGHFNWPQGRLGYILNMYTLPEYRRRGICGNILQRLVADGKAMDLGRIELHASAAGEPLYRKQDFADWKEPLLVLPLK